MEDPLKEGKFKKIGLGRNYETMAFHAHKDGAYWDADVTREVRFSSRWSIEKITDSSDNDADAMHNAVVAEIVAKLKNGESLENT